MKRNLLIVLICMIASLLPAALIVIGISERGHLPDDLEPYADTVTVRSPAGEEFTYERGSLEHAAAIALFEGATRAERAEAECVSEHYDRFDVTLDGERSIFMTLYVSAEPFCGFVMTESEKYYSLPSSALVSFLKIDAVACLWVGETPPRATLGDTELKSSVVEWSRLLPDGEWVSSGEYVSRTPTEYSISSAADIAPVFEDKPDSTAVVVYDGDGTRYFEGTADELRYISLPRDRDLSVMYSAEWENEDGSRVRAAYSFRVPKGN